MGDRYDLSLKCVYCDEVNEVWYAPTSSSDTFNCKKCNKIHFVTPNFQAIKIEDATLDMVREGFVNTTTGGLTDAQIENNCREHFKDIQNKAKAQQKNN